MWSRVGEDGPDLIFANREHEKVVSKSKHVKTA